MANNIRENTAPLPDTEPKSGEMEKGISVKSTAHSHQKDHMKKSPVEPRNGRGEKGGYSKENRRKMYLVELRKLWTGGFTNLLQSYTNHLYEVWRR